MGIGLDQGLAQGRHHQVRQHRGEPRSRAEHDQVGRPHGVHRLGTRPKVVGEQRDRLDRPLRGGDLDLAADGAQPLGVAGVQAADLGGDVERREGHRQHPAARAEEPADPVQGRDVVAEQLPETHDQEVAGDVTAHLAGAGEAVLEDLGPGLAPLVVTAQRRERHPQVAGWEHAELRAQPARGAAVVRDRDDGGDRRPEAVAARTARRAARARPRTPSPGGRVARRRRARHSRPRSRWTVLTSYPLSRSSRPISSVMATLRCLPPVQPMAIDMNRLPSRR